jgi:glycosyltransferase involved in cell wall biosynthesis
MISYFENRKVDFQKMITKNEMIWPKFSIITPSYNQGEYIEETIQSVLSQNYPNLEYIIVDGNSTDNSVDNIKKYEAFLSWWVSEKDGGQAQAINKGLKKSTGEIIAWINSDDRYTPYAFSAVRDFFQQNPEVDMVYGDAEIIDSTGNFIMHRKELAFDKTMARLIGFGILIPQPATFWRRNIFETVGYLNENLHYALDSDYWSRIAEKHEIRHIPIVLAQARYHDESKTMLSKKGLMPLAKVEISQELSLQYLKLPISKILSPYFSPFIRNIYRTKRIFQRFLLGHYFKGYFRSRFII